MKPINDIVNETMRQMETYGLSAGTIRMQYYGIFKPLINLHATAGQPAYSSEIIGRFFSSYEDRLAAGTVTQSHFATVKRAIQFLDSCASTGTVDFSYAIRPIKVIPSDCHMLMVNECIQGIKGLSSREGKNIGLYMRHFFCFMEQKIPDSSPVTDSLVREFILEACAKYEGSIGYIMRAVRCITAYLRSKGLMGGDTDYKAFTPKAPRTKMQVPYSPDEVEAMLGATDPTPLGMRNRAMLLLGYGDGLRAIDIIRLTLDDIDWRKGELQIVQSKTSEPLKLTMNPTTMNAVADYILKARPESSLRTVFLTVTKPYRPLASSSRLSVMMVELSEKAGVEIIPGRAFHGVRRSFAVNLAEADVPLATISQMMGHTGFSSDRQYLTFSREQTGFCAMGFDLVPVTSECYISDAFPKGGGR